MHFSFLARLPFIGLLCASAACSSSSTKESHDAGHPTDATVMDASMDVSIPDSNPCVPDGLNSPDVRVYPLDAGPTWSALYHDFFGPTGLAGCAGMVGSCHGSTAAHGYTVSGFLCPTGEDASAACWAGMTSKGDGGANILTPPFNDGGLGTILCQNICVGIMPDGCTYYFTPDDMQRIQDWVRSGAPDN